MAHARRSKTSFPLSISAACNCGQCDGEEIEDDVTLYCVEEAASLYYDRYAEASEAEETGARPEDVKPGEITDAAVAAAMREAKRIHLETFGVQT